MMPELLSPMDELPFWLHLFLVDELPFLLHWLQLFYGCIVILAPAIFRDELSFWTYLLYGWITIFAPWIFILAPSILWINCQFWLHLFYRWVVIFAPSFLSTIINLAISQNWKTKILVILETQEGVLFPFYEKDQSWVQGGCWRLDSKFWCTHTYMDIKPSGGYHKLWERSKVETRIDLLENFITCGFTWKGERDNGKI